MKNIPYIKEVEVLGTRSFINKNNIEVTRINTRITNPITKESPYLHSSSSNRGNRKTKRLSGNNRANTSTRPNKHSRLN